MAKDFAITTLRGGQNDTDPETAIREDQATIASNVEFNLSTLGEKRRGCVAIALPAAFGADPIDAVTFLYRHLPTQLESESQLWALGIDLDAQNFSLQYKDTTWHIPTLKDDIDVITSGSGFGVIGQSLHGKLFLAYKSVGGINRLHVWDGTTLRRCGLAEPAAPTSAETGAAGVYAGTRYARIRYTVQDGSSVTTLRSDCSETLTITPSGTKTGTILTKPASINEGETHWEIEFSTDNGNFYRVATQTVATTTYTDTVVYATGYASSGTLSEDIGAYKVIPSGKYLTVDQDRLIIGGSWEDSSLASRVSWTPVFNDPGIQNDERIPDATDQFLDLDGFEGGGLTGLSAPTNGYIFAFKWSHIYKLVSTGLRTRAYDVFNVTKSRGALPGSIVEAIDETGRACVYFLDPKVGPCRIGAGGLQGCGQDILMTWDTVNIDATIVARSVFYPEMRQVHWWVATNGSDTPNLKIILQTNNTQESETGVVRGGWSTADNRIAQAYAVCQYAENIDANVARSQVLRPFIGLATWTISASTIHDIVQRCDTGPSDGWTTGDNNAYYRGRVITKPYTPFGVMNRFGVAAATLVAKAAAAVTISVKAIRDFGLETLDRDVSLTPTGTETYVIRPIDNMSFSELRVVQFEIGDLDEDIVPTSVWELEQLHLKPREEQTA